MGYFENIRRQKETAAEYGVPAVSLRDGQGIQRRCRRTPVERDRNKEDCKEESV
jgi:hypothetical protein